MTVAVAATWRGVAVAALLLALAAAAAAATPAATPDHARSAQPDPLSLVQGSGSAWFASRSDAGCYLMSPYRDKTSRVAIGRHPTLGLGLFAVSFPLATRIKTVEPMLLRVGGQDVAAAGQVTAGNLVFVALDAPALDAELAELQDSGTLWLEIRQTWVMHDGHGVREALAAYRSACTASPVAAAAAAGAAP